MPVHKKIIKIDKDKYEELKKSFNTVFDLYISDNDYYVIGTIEELKAVGVDPGVPFS
tara:strand:- start:801 stop:971 length:171 start_codon:yes stop_codon:yes gene_type:complete